MSNGPLRVLIYDLTNRQGTIETLGNRDQIIGGSGLAAFLFSRYGKPERPWNDSRQPFILTIGPLTGYFPLMSKVVCAFKSPYHNQYTESHGGGRAALAMRFAGFDGIVIQGRANNLVCLDLGAHHIDCRNAGFMQGLNAISTGKVMRRMFKHSSGHRSMIRIGPSGEHGLAMAGINIDTYRHFGRMGGGAVMGNKNLKGLVIEGDGEIQQPLGKEYSKLYAGLHEQVTSTDMMNKYYDLGTAANLKTLNDLHSLPWNNLQKTYDQAIHSITGKKFADDALLRNAACSGCPVGCIHIGYFRERAIHDNRYHFHQVAYDYEPIFAVGSMLGITDVAAILRILDNIELMSLDVMSAGVALAWATEATQRGLISTRETIVPLSFGDYRNYQQAALLLGKGKGDFYQLLGQGTMRAADHYGGSEFACVLGQEMAGYATGELFFVAQALGFRHSHLDTGAYSWDQKNSNKNVDEAVQFLMDDEPDRVLLTSMVACLFARKVYTNEVLAECLQSLGFDNMAGSLKEQAQHITKHRWQLRFASGFTPGDITIPKRFYTVSTWKGKIDKEFLDTVKDTYGKRLIDLYRENGKTETKG